MSFLSPDDGAETVQLSTSPNTTERAILQLKDAMKDEEEPAVPPFEGPEKLFEIWFEPSNTFDSEDQQGLGRKGLRTVARAVWDEMLSLVHCKILNTISNEYLDAYLLSESSMFVWNAKLILKTCGTTTLLYAVPKVIEIAKSVGLREVDSVFYSRKKFMFPKKQQLVHTKWHHERKFLDRIVPNGNAYSLGSLNGEPWHLFLREHSQHELLEDESVEETKKAPGEEYIIDQTLEILMSDLDPQQAKNFFKNEAIQTAEQCTEVSGVAALFPEAVVDAYLFEPCGYSVNGIFGKEYFTIHVTPQKSSSYASFETNAPREKYGQLVDKVMAIFRPGNVTISLFSNEPNNKDINIRMSDWNITEAGYTCGIRTHYQFEDYNLLFLQAKKGLKKVRKGRDPALHNASSPG